MSSTKHKEEKQDFQVLDSTTNTQMEVVRTRRKKYGNMIVILETENILITLGPDYWCFLIAFTFFTLLQLFTIITLYAVYDHYITYLFVVGAVLQQLFYVMVATSNPGIAMQTDYDTEGDQQPDSMKKFCRICQVQMLPRMRHCRFCGVCIKGHDHHCPWTSKCIGELNLIRFYLFSCWTPLYLLVCVIALSMALTDKQH